MKHPIIATLILIFLFLITQIIGVFVVREYSPNVITTINENGTEINKTVYNLPYGAEPPEDITPRGSLFLLWLH